MSIIIEADELGVLHIPPDALTEPHRRFRFQAEEGGYSLRPVDDDKPFYEVATAEEWVDDLRRWAASLPRREGPPIPVDALRRKSMYD